MLQYCCFTLYINVTFCGANAQGAPEKEILFDISCYFTGFIVVLLILSFWSREKEVKHDI